MESMVWMGAKRFGLRPRSCRFLSVVGLGTGKVQNKQSGSFAAAIQSGLRPLGIALQHIR